MQEVESLERCIHRLQLEHDILERANELIKKDQGVNLQLLTNRKKSLLIEALRGTYTLKEPFAQVRLPLYILKFIDGVFDTGGLRLRLRFLWIVGYYLDSGLKRQTSLN